MHPAFIVHLPIARRGAAIVNEADTFPVCSELTVWRESDNTIRAGPGKIRRQWDPGGGETNPDLGWGS